MTALAQTGAVVALGLRTLPQRALSSVVIVTSVAGVVATLVAALALAASIGRVLARTGHPDRAIIMSSGSVSEAVSSLSREMVKTISTAPGVLRSNGVPLASPEVVMSVRIPKHHSQVRAGIVLRGVTPTAFTLRPEILMVAGRPFRHGLREVIVGRAAQSRFDGLEIGKRVWLRDGEWTIVGVFESGDSHESEMWCDAETLLTGLAQNSFSTVFVKLTTPASFDELAAALSSNPALPIEVLRESAFFERQSREISAVVYRFANVVGVIMAMGALFGAINTMYTAVRDRAVEIGTLRALGFRPYCLAVATLSESLLLAIAGALVGSALAWLVFNGNVAGADGSDAQVVFKIYVGPELALIGVLWAVAVGLIGGVFPAFKAATLAPASVMRGQ